MMVDNTVAPITCPVTEENTTWEVWHQRYGHISYGGLKKIYEKELVCGFKVKTDSLIPDCIMCTEAKQCEEPHNKQVSHKMDPGKLTHIDLWGKYKVASIN
jgi:hypothetical protein